MKIVDFPERNKIYVAPKGSPEVLDLPVFNNEENTLKISCWEFTPAERLLAIFQNKIWLHVHLNIQPPVLITPEYPFVNENGMAPEKLENVVEAMIERKIKQFFSLSLEPNNILVNMTEEQTEMLTRFMLNFTKFIFELPSE